jgi:hypothetical protein
MQSLFTGEMVDYIWVIVSEKWSESVIRFRGPSRTRALAQLPTTSAAARERSPSVKGNRKKRKLGTNYNTGQRNRGNCAKVFVM